jgi:hypothetical protein
MPEPVRFIESIRMKTKKLITPFSISSGLTLCISLWMTSGCSKSPSDPAPVSKTPQGEFIQGPPIDADASGQQDTASNSENTSEETPISENSSVELVTQTTTVPDASPQSGTTTHSTNAVIMTASQPEVLLEIVKEELPLLEGKYASISFDKLASFDYTMPEDLTEPVADDDGQVYKEQIPAPIKALNGQNISLKGFMLPLKVEKSLVTEMLIMRDQSMCCYGTVPKINEWVSVRMEEKGVKPIMDEPVTIFGTLKVGEVLENGYLVGIYEMDGQSMTAETSNN